MATHVGVVERLSYGHPADMTDVVAPVRLAPRPTTALVARILLGAIFLMSGIAKLTDVGNTVEQMTKAGIPAAGSLVYIAAFAEIFGAIAIMSGLLTRLAAVGLVVYLALATLAFHNFWSFEGAAQKAQMINFMKNLAIGGGLLALVANGAGRYSLDARVRRPIEP